MVSVGCQPGDSPDGEPESQDGGGELDSSRSHARSEALRVASAAEHRRMLAYVDGFIEPDAVVDVLPTAPAGEDEIACVELHRQPALMRHAMRGHTLELAPRTLPRGEPEGGAEQAPEHAPGHTLGHTLEQAQPMSELPAEQALLAMCPDGTIPIRRASMRTLARFRTLDDFFAKAPGYVAEQMPMDDDDNDGGDPAPDARTGRRGHDALHQYAHAYRVIANRGAESVLNLWNPYTYSSNEFSLSQIWVARGSAEKRQTVEAGWQVYEDKYGDRKARLFIYFTPDNYHRGGCYNLDCGAFVQVSNRVYLGGAFRHYSKAGGDQRIITLLIYKDGVGGHWWLRYGHIWVGYWPRHLFHEHGLRDRADTIDFGGEIINRHRADTHTRTHMGSGRGPSMGFGHSAYQKRLRYVDLNNHYRTATGVRRGITDPWCYDLILNSSISESWRQHFYYGGAGFGLHCQ